MSAYLPQNRHTAEETDEQGHRDGLGGCCLRSVASDGSDFAEPPLGARSYILGDAFAASKLYEKFDNGLGEGEPE